jgi:hypothetical protein
VSLPVAAFATNVEDLFLPAVLNLVEHLVGSLGAGIAFATAAYMSRERQIQTFPVEEKSKDMLSQFTIDEGTAGRDTVSGPGRSATADDGKVTSERADDSGLGHR